MAITRAKFRLETIKNYASGYAEVEFTAVNDKVNEVWSKYTPAGRLLMTVKNELVTDALVLGRQYYLDITEAD